MLQPTAASARRVDAPGGAPLRRGVPVGEVDAEDEAEHRPDHRDDEEADDAQDAAGQQRGGRDAGLAQPAPGEQVLRDVPATASRRWRPRGWPSRRRRAGPGPTAGRRPRPGGARAGTGTTTPSQADRGHDQPGERRQVVAPLAAPTSTGGLRLARSVLVVRRVAAWTPGRRTRPGCRRPRRAARPGGRGRGGRRTAARRLRAGPPGCRRERRTGRSGRLRSAVLMRSRRSRADLLRSRSCCARCWCDRPSCRRAPPCQQ